MPFKSIEKRRAYERAYRTKHKEEYREKYRTDIAYREKRRGYDRAYSATHKHVRAAWRATHKKELAAWYEKNKERVNKQSHENYLKNRQAVIQRTTRYHFENKEKIKKYYQKYYEEIRLEVLARIDPAMKCAMCDCDDTRFLEVNHINGGGRKEHIRYQKEGHNMILLIHHGKRGVEDLNLLCRACNSLDHLERKYGHTGLKVVWEKPVTNIPVPSLNQILCNMVEEQ
ncbi:MAG: hypothetical protein ACRD9Q_08820 [Nitrososphaeraceae archaeon]